MVPATSLVPLRAMTNTAIKTLRCLTKAFWWDTYRAKVREMASTYAVLQSQWTF
jgi:hypothetical protein